MRRVLAMNNASIVLPENELAESIKAQTHIINYNPDVLTCLANLSNDEVFTPPALVNQMLDILPADLWTNSDAKFLDPVTKSGVFLREIAKRLIRGLEAQMPDLQTRINHIFKHQLYGMAITELTSLLARRSVYCAKAANSKLSICDGFDDEQGNIRYARIAHTWSNGKCTHCGASQEVYDRDGDLETHAYPFIHTDKPAELFGTDMKFDVIIGNPPYQLSDGGHGTSAKPIYHKFVEQAKKLNPRYLAMIIPSRWFAGGKGLDEFRSSMLCDKKIRQLTDFFDSTLCFPGVDISGGVCYFLWDSQHSYDCLVTSIGKDGSNTMLRPLLENDSDVFLRFNKSIPIIRKIESGNETFANIVSSRKPFGFETQVQALTESQFEGSVKIYAYPKNGFVSQESIEKGVDSIHKYKIYVSYAYGERGSFPYLVIGKPFIGEPNSCCSETYLNIGPFDDVQACQNVISYMRTRFFRFLVLLKKNTQHATKNAYSFVPMQDFSEPWTDEKLYAKYGLTTDEIAFIESMIRPMDLTQEVADA